MKIHFCLYKDGEEVININEVQQINFLVDCICIHGFYNSFWYYYFEFDKIEVNFYD